LQMGRYDIVEVGLFIGDEESVCQEKHI